MLINLHMGLKALLQNRIQTLLTLSGMSIGVAMVVLVSGLGLGAQQQIEHQIESAGPTLVTVKAGNFVPPAIMSNGQQDNGGGELAEGSMSENDILNSDVLTENAAYRDARQRMAAPKVTRSRSPAWPLGHAEKFLLAHDIAHVRAIAASVAGNLSMDDNPGLGIRTANVYGFEPGWEEMHGWVLDAGHLISSEEHQANAPVMLVTGRVAERLWPNQAALGQTLNIGGRTLNVVGIIRNNDSSGNSIIVPRLYVPLGLAQQFLNRSDYDAIKVRSTSVANTSQVVTDIRDSLRILRELPEDTLNDFQVESQSTSAMPSLGMDPRLARAVQSNIKEFEQESWEEMALSLRQAGRTFTLLLSAAAAVSLVVGGIGVMNIMLVSVAARTREIGLRVALGARMNDVLLQFMVEAVTLAAMGGLIGLVLGYMGLYLAANGLQWATAISPTMFMLAIAMATVTGIVFGYGPARRAASLDPVVALKSE
ncbi:MAG: ABC transporter permease [Pseudomonadales bacterium]|nr:ABC transporter permease [Pseudomonadales bacterium]